MALADGTRLRLLNLMRDEEVCVWYFTEVLGDSQPKISRHLAYLRSTGLVSARRDGKWVHYRVSWPRGEEERRVLEAVFGWLDGRPEMRRDRERYMRVRGSHRRFEEVERSPAALSHTAGNDQPPVLPSSAHNELEEFLL